MPDPDPLLEAFKKPLTEEPRHPFEGAKARPNPGHFQPGISGNPGGRPKGEKLKTSILRRLGKDPDENGEGARQARLLEKLLDCCESGDGKAAEPIFKLIEMLEPTVKQSQVELMGKGELEWGTEEE